MIADSSVAEYHAEIVVADDARIFVADCGTPAGTWLASRDGRRAWEPLRQAFVRRDDVLRLGEYERLVSDILSPVIANSAPGADDSNRRDARRPSGRLRRDPMTGEIVRGRG